VVVVEKASGYASGDLTKAYEGFPLWFPPYIPQAVDCPECVQLCPPSDISGVVTWTPWEGVAAALGGVTVDLHAAGHDNLFGTPDDWWGWTMTNTEGQYHFWSLPAGWYEIFVEYKHVSKLTRVYLDCDEGIFVNFGLVEPAPPCLGDIGGTATISNSAQMVGATVELWADDAFVDSTLTNSEGDFSFSDVDCGTDYHLKILFLCEHNIVSVDSYDFDIENNADLDMDVVVNLGDCTADWGAP
jgi:hypothetical protein